MKYPQRANLQRQKLDERVPGRAGPLGDQLRMGTRTLFVVLAGFHNCTVVVVAPLCEFAKSHYPGSDGCDLWYVITPH